MNLNNKPRSDLKTEATGLTTIIIQPLPLLCQRQISRASEDCLVSLVSLQCARIAEVKKLHPSKLDPSL